MSSRDHYLALKTEVVAFLNAGSAKMVLAALQAGKTDKWCTLHVNSTLFSATELQATDGLAYLGFRRNNSLLQPSMPALVILRRHKTGFRRVALSS